MAAKSQWLLFIYLGFCAAWMDERPVLESRDGNLFISAAKDRNITLKILGNGYVNVNEINLLHVASAAQNATRLIERWRTGYLAEVESSLQRLTQLVEGPEGLERRMAMLKGIGEDGGSQTGPTSRNQSVTVANAKVRLLAQRVRRLEDKVRTMEKKLKENDCSSTPCLNGGTCQDLYEGYQCHCPSNWEGPNCMTDVNECVRFLGTDLGCQNGATCINFPGSYRCDCTAGWHGLHCATKTSGCNSQNSNELCGHGVCVSKPASPLGYTCICDQGWEADGSNPACVKDVDECAGNHPPCSVNPWVACRNAPGTFFCDSCPPGYTGNGYYCRDIDECLMDNGGCSTSPSVHCINTMGSRICGPCPTGYRGDGVTCVYVGGCAINNGGCHPLATCVENSALTSAYVLCRCPAGFAGDGIGPNGCQRTTDVSVGSACSGSNPCVHGTCVPGPSAQGYVCICTAGYTGVTCNVQIDPCSPNPCRNNGVCTIVNGAVNCDCPTTFTGNRCEIPRQTCGGVSRNAVGHLEFPIGASVYQHGLSCAWLLITNSSLVLNVTFVRFNLEQSTDCKYDFLQIHDGRNAGSQIIGRFCGNTLPHTNGSIVSSHNALYFWFHSDSSISHDGFAFHWNSIEPVCGSTLTDDYGTISSPGSPGRYPPNRDCYWRIMIRPNKRIQFHFGQLMLEKHPTCQSDYLEITDADNERLGLYCNHTRPPPLVVPSSQVTIHFHSDSAGQDAGFQIHYSSIEGLPGCSGVYTSPSGTISPPMQSSLYQQNLECEWKIQMPIGERIQISWSKFELEESTSCRYDFVEIYDGGTIDSPLLGRYCGFAIPPTIRSNSNTVLVIFKSDITLEMGGFVLSYNILCGGEFTEESGILHSPMYPNYYYRSRTCTYDIVQPVGRRIVLNMIDIDIEGLTSSDCYFDHLQIFDGDNENATKLATLCGSVEDMPTDPFYSTHNYMFLKFTTDGSVQGRGFKANYTTIASRCGGLYKTPTGTIQSPTEDGIYPDNINCIWTIQAPPGYVVQLTFFSFHLEQSTRCRHDYLKIYENSTSTTSDLLGTFCGTKSPPVLTTQSREMTVIFHSDWTVSRAGFVAIYLFIDASKVCGGHFVKLNGVIKSPNYPDRYPNKRECVWVIEAPNEQKVVLNVTHFEIESHSSCTFDYLEVRNGGYETSPLIGKFCGTDIPNEIVGQTNMLYLKFVSDQSRTYSGFKIDWDSTTAGCGGILTGANGDIISPNYPQPYMQLTDCYWKISVAAGNLVRLLIVDLDLEHHPKCRFDYIEVSEGIDRRNSQRYCGNPYPKVINAKSNTVTVRFRSDFTNSGRGFHLKYETVCQNKVHGFYGVIESPNFPNKYEHYTNCSWIIDAPIGNRINLTFSHFNLEGPDSLNNCLYDYLLVKEGEDDVPNKELMKLCNSDTLPPKIHSSQHQVFLTFATDALIAFNGFRVEWVVDGCGGHLTRPFDSFTSPGYPFAYPMNINCEWLIEVDYMHSVELTIHDINTEKQKGCYFDSLQIFNGNDEHGMKLMEICYSEKPVVYTSFGNKMFLKFHSDMSYAARGFNISYRSVPITCGGRFTADTGIVHSSNYPQNYPHKQVCEWLLQVEQNHVVNLTFLDFDVEKTVNCTDDNVKIYDGSTETSPLLAILCGNKLPSSYASTGNEMLIVMKTDGIISAKGFKARYSRGCGARIIVKDQGYLTPASSYTTDEVYDNWNCTWTLIAENPAEHVTATFTHLEFDMDGFFSYDFCNSNYVEVHEGQSLDGPSFGKWCENVVPLPITSTGNALTVHLQAESDFFRHFAITYSTLNSACGGTYTSYQGKIASPGYPNSYPLNAECVWILNNSPGNRLRLTFSEFDLQPSENCDLDYLEIRENNGIGKLISVSCGSSIQPVRSSSKLWIKFKSDGDGVAKGFVGDYTFEGGNELSGPTGRITSPLYPLPYQRRDTTSWRITVDFQWVVRIEIANVFIENYGSACFSYLRIYDGYNEEAPILLETCNLDTPEPVTTSSNVAYIQLVTDILRLGSWFDLTWLQIPRAIEGTNIEETVSDCVEEVGLMGARNSSYDFTSPGWPHGYAENLRCTWVFASPPGTHLVLRILLMDLEESTDCVFDSVSIYDGNALTSNNANLIQKLCLANSTSVWLKASNVMTVKFESDGSQNKSGFSAYVYRDCGGKLEGPNGVIEINNSTSIRPTWQYNCEWTVEVKAGRTIEVTFVQMSIQQGPSSTCTDNYIMLKNGGEVSSPLLGNGKYCGDTLPVPLTTTGNRLYVKVVGARLSINFKLTYREVRMNCGGDYILRGKELTISTPNYPNIPPPYSDCMWKVMSPTRERISIHFVERFDLSYSNDCEREYVEVRDGGTDSSKLLGRFCRDVAPSSMASTGNMMYVHFYTDIPEPKNGFKAVLTVGEVCGGILRGSSGVINSPNYPFFYPKNQTCVWWVIAPTDHTLKFEFRDLHLPGFRVCDNTDHVQISERIPENETRSDIGTYCGLNKPEIIETSSNEAIITFKSDNFEYTTYRGFSLNFSSSQEVCGGEFTAMSGIIKSNGYPNVATRSRYCDWRIRLPKGYQVVIEILDLDIIAMPEPPRLGYSLSFYNDFRFKSRIKLIGNRETIQRVKSSSNTMMIGYSSSPGYRGFKLRYSAAAPAPCGGIVKDIRGNLSAPSVPPFNESSYFCVWSVEAPESMRSNVNNTGLTLTVKVTGLVGGSTYLSRFCFNYQYISLTNSDVICGNFTEPVYLKSPNFINELTVVNGTYGKMMHYNIEYQWQRCGGIFEETTNVVTAPKNVSFPVSCVWYFNYPNAEETIQLYFTKLNLSSNGTNYISVKRNGAFATELRRFQGNAKPFNVTSFSNQLRVEYFAEQQNDFEFVVQLANHGCGGALRGKSREISSPQFPGMYPNNAECTWEITADNGYHVGLVFVDRFNLETSADCKNDYVEVFDWVNGTEGYKWQSLGKVCGRNTPKPFNSTSNRMKVTFRSNELIQAEGFRALWYENCGGIFVATKNPKIIQSPSYPNLYRPNLFCNYTLKGGEEDIIVEFMTFQLERSRRDCRFDNLTITWDETYMQHENTYCGENKPPSLKSKNVEIIFKTDKYIQRNGFAFKYYISNCGGTITTPGEIGPPMNGDEYFGDVQCHWKIYAPSDKNVVLRFEYFVLEYTSRCIYDYVAIYDGESNDESRQLGTVCGNLTESLPVFKSTNNSMLVYFYTDDSRHYGGFRAKILFVKSIEAGCGGNVNLIKTPAQLFKTQKGSTYDSLEDCHWDVITSPEKNIRFTINSMDIKNSTVKRNSNDKCTGDYLEVHDGSGPFSELLGTYCGNQVPQPILSSSNKLWIRFVSDGTSEGAGVSGTLEVVNALCGIAPVITNDTRHVLASPNYPNPYGSGVKCRWTIRSTADHVERLRIQFLDFDLADSAKCRKDFVQIVDTMNRKYIDQGFGQDMIWSGDHSDRYVDTHSPTTSYRYCGNQLPHDYYSYSSEIEITFSGDTVGHKGFKLDYGSASCNRNYTAEQGRIVHESIENCWVTIVAPQNHTISLYFNRFMLYDPDQCTKSALQIYEGSFSGKLLATLCGMEIPSPIFSTGNLLSLRSWSEWHSIFEYYDITYTTTEKGRGCGGRLFNYAGSFSSPLYPNEYRNNTICTWDISVPPTLKVALEFSVFDIGSKNNCEHNYMKIYDVMPNGDQIVANTYCGGDDPARFESETSRIIVTYTSTLNNFGTGWLATFKAIE